MKSTLTKSKGPATAPTVPSLGSTNPLQEKDMNNVEHTIDPGPAPEHPWVAARRLSRQLSNTLALCDEGRWFAQILPAGQSYAMCFGAIPLSHGQDEIATDTINRLAEALSVALDAYLGGRFQAVVNPASVGGNSILLTTIKDSDRRTS
jgi:hypothetical protein